MPFGGDAGRLFAQTSRGTIAWGRYGICRQGDDRGGNAGIQWHESSRSSEGGSLTTPGDEGRPRMNTTLLTRRSLVGGAIVAPILARPAPARMAAPAVFGLPIGFPDRLPGDGFFVRHGYACENTWYNPGGWHTGEDWYAIGEETAGALIYAVAAGEVVFVGSNYPGLVVIVRH